MPWFLVSTPEYETDDGQNEPLRVTRDSVEVEAADEESARFLGAIALHKERSQWLHECEGRLHASDLEAVCLGEACVACECSESMHQDADGTYLVGGCDGCAECPAFEAPMPAVAAA